jgi:hypothetical protein
MTDKMDEKEDSSDSESASAVYSDVDDPRSNDGEDSAGDSDSDELQSSDESTYSSLSSISKASFAIYLNNSAAGNTSRCFYFTRAQAAPVVLYNSPPAFHPSDPLVVWPLGEGSILFADFMLKTYFVRELRASISHSKSSQLIICYTNIH